MSIYDSVKWGVHVNGPDSVLAAHNFQQAVEKCKEINDMLVSMIDESLPNQEYRPMVFARIFVWNRECANYAHEPELTDWNEIC